MTRDDFNDTSAMTVKLPVSLRRRLNDVASDLLISPELLVTFVIDRLFGPEVRPIDNRESVLDRFLDEANVRKRDRTYDLKNVVTRTLAEVIASDFDENEQLSQVGTDAVAEAIEYDELYDIDEI